MVPELPYPLVFRSSDDIGDVVATEPFSRPQNCRHHFLRFDGVVGQLCLSGTDVTPFTRTGMILVKVAEELGASAHPRFRETQNLSQIALGLFALGPDLHTVDVVTDFWTIARPEKQTRIGVFPVAAGTMATIPPSPDAIAVRRGT